MREIQFRAKPVYRGGKQTPWVYGTFKYLWQNRVTPGASDNGRHEQRKDKGVIIGEHNDETEVLYDTVGQFTGLTDKQGHRIYEGDILKGGDVIHVVRYFDDEGGFVGVLWPLVRDTNGTVLTSALHQWWINMYGKAIIGNIYDNPDLAFWTGDDSEAKDAARRFTEGFEKYAGVKVKP